MAGQGWPAATVTETFDELGDIVWMVQLHEDRHADVAPVATHSHRRVLHFLEAAGIEATDVSWVGRAW